MSGAVAHNPSGDSQMQLLQAQSAASYYYETYQNCASQLNSYKQQLLHKQNVIRQLQAQIQPMNLELRWYQAAFPNARKTYHLQTDLPNPENPAATIPIEKSPKSGQKSNLKPKPGQESNLKPKHSRKSSGKRMRTKARGARKVKPADVRRSLRLQGINVIEEEP
ncbi:hypothetical protein TWF706_010346 [Orbilia oligospora]|nr:hypothetical protein TWF706_010346 [Orbilia oligospora]